VGEVAREVGVSTHMLDSRPHRYELHPLFLNHRLQGIFIQAESRHQLLKSRILIP
jgi:hypothetical protein